MENREKVVKLIDKQLHSLKVKPTQVRKGHQVNPLHVLSFSRSHPELDLQKEELLLAAYTDPAKPFYLLTDKFLWLLKDNVSTRIAWNEAIPETSVFKGTSVEEAESAAQELLNTVFKSLSEGNIEKKKTLDDFINKYKGLLKEEEQNYKNEELFFDGAYVEMLATESERAAELCRELDADKDFTNSLNMLFKSRGEADEGYSASHLLLYDLIKAYNKVVIEENEKMRFSLAYFFEKLQGKKMDKGVSIQRLNKMVSHDSFIQNIQKIRQADFINLGEEYRNEYVVPSILFRLKHPLFDKSANIIYHFASIIAKGDGGISEDEKKRLNEVLHKARQPKVHIEGVQIKEAAADDSLQKVMEELNELIGLENVKKSIQDLTNWLKIQKVREEQGLKTTGNSLHSVFMGPPGTGKTTVARLLSRIYKHLSYLSSGHLLETDRAGLVAGFVGQTALKVNEVVDQAKGGVLFIDEAYSLVPDDSGRDFGREAVETLLKRMEDLREDFVVVVAGYSEPMKFFIESNPGLRSRFNRYYKFEHFFPSQLLDIFKIYCKKSDFVLQDDAAEKLMEIFDRLYEKRDEGFGNARVVRNIFEKIIENQANRLISITPLTRELLMSITEEDVPEILKTVEEVYMSTESGE